MDTVRLRPILISCMLAIILLLAAASLAMAAPTGGEITTGGTEHGTGSTSDTSTIHGGNVSEVNVTGTEMTTRWAGFYGFISGGIQLSDSTANKFYEWTISNFTGAVVYASSAALSDWVSLRAINNSVAPSFVVAEGTDRYNNTFTQSATFQTPGVGPINNAPYALSYQNGVAGTLRTYVLITSDNSINVWAGVAETNATSFKSGEKVDYQILAPAESTGTTYNFYLELP